MQLYVHRDTRGPGRPTLGKLYIWKAGAWHYFCETLEDEYRGDDPAAKVKGKTAIGCGTFALLVTHSPAFKRLLPLVDGVPGFVGIRIHPGNTQADTEGCLLVGRVRGTARGEPAVLDSGVTFAELFRQLDAAKNAKTGYVGTITYALTAPAGV